MLLNIGVLLMAISFAIVSVALCIFLFRMAGSIASMGSAADKLERKLAQSITHVEGILTEAEKTADDVEVKTKALDSVFETVRNTGEVTYTAATEWERAAKNFQEAPGMPGTKPFVAAIHMSETAFGLFNSWGRGKRRSKRSVRKEAIR